MAVLPMLLMVLGALAFAAALAGKLPGFLFRALPSSDTISSVLLAKAAGTPAHGTIYLGVHPGYADLLLNTLALHLPDSRVSAQVITYAVYVLGCLLLAATVRRWAGWWGAVVTGLASVAATPMLLVDETSPSGRVPSLANLVLLGWLATVPLSRARARPALLALTAVGVGVVTGVDAASDALFVVVGVLPFLGVAVVVWVRHRDRCSAVLALGAVTTLAVAAATASLTTVVAREVGLMTQHNPVHLAGSRGVIHTIHVLGGDAGLAIGGVFSALGQGLMSYLEAGAGLLVCAAVVAALVYAWRTVRGELPAESRDRARQVHVVFWALVGLANLGAVLGTSYAADLTALRFLTPLWLAFAALLPLLGERRRGARLATAVGLAALATADAWALAGLSLPPPIQSSPLVQTLEADHVSLAYADYWDANVITWATEGRVDVRQVIECGPDGARLCPYLVNAAESWFRPGPGPVAVIVDPRYSLTQPPSPSYGAPQQVTDLGAITLYVYDHGLELAPSP